MIKKIIIPLLSLLLSLAYSSTLFAAFLPPVQSKNAMVATGQALATQAGIDILKQGGNAIDAAVAVGYALTVTHPCCGGIGGGGFMTIHLANGNNVFLDFRETAPAAISSKLYLDKNGQVDPKLTRVSALSVGVPGTVLGLNTALKHYGRLSLQQVMAPAIKLAKEGFTLTADDAHSFRNTADRFAKHPNVAKIFLKKGNPYQAGDKLVQSQLAKTLTDISQQGRGVFYKGWIAKEIVKDNKAKGGVLSLDDFSHYQLEQYKPISCQFHGYQIITAPPPGSGTSVCQILKTISAYPLVTGGFHAASSIHQNVEAMRYAFFDRNNKLGDPSFVNNPVATLLSKQHIESIRRQIKPNQAGNSNKLFPQSAQEKPQTTHYSIIDKQGNAVSLTYTLNGHYGNDDIAGNTGFFLNNELDDFTIKLGTANMTQLMQGKNNLIAPGKRPLSSMSPTIVLKNKRPILIVGAAGGSTIVTSIVQTIENVLVYDMDINTAVNMPRYHMQWLPDKIFYERYALSPDTLKKLQAMGYSLQEGAVYGPPTWGQVAAIYRDPTSGLLTGATDNRRPGGAVMGY